MKLTHIIKIALAALMTGAASLLGIKFNPWVTGRKKGKDPPKNP